MVKRKAKVKKSNNLNKVISRNNCYLYKDNKLVEITDFGKNVSIVQIIPNGNKIEAATKHLKWISLN